MSPAAMLGVRYGALRVFSAFDHAHVRIRNVFSFFSFFPWHSAYDLAYIFLPSAAICNLTFVNPNLV